MRDDQPPERSTSWRARWNDKGLPQLSDRLKAIAGAVSGSLVSWLALVVSSVSLVVSISSVFLSQKAGRIDRAQSEVSKYLTAAESRRVSGLISAETKAGTDYSAAQSNPTLRENISHRLNELELIAEGVNQQRYDEETVFKNLGVVIYKSVKAHLHGKSGSTPAGETWSTNPSQTPLFPARDHFPELRKLYSKWFPEDRFREYQP